jgi:hypothetical protein
MIYDTGYPRRHPNPGGVRDVSGPAMVKYVLRLTAAGALILAVQFDPLAAQINSQPVAREATKDPLQLTEQEKAAVIKAAIEAKSHQPTPNGFAPVVGASVPRAVFIHGFKPEIAREVPALKHYWYAYLNQEIVLVDATQSKIVAVIPLPAKFVSSGQPHQGAAEPADSQNKNGTSNTGSVPAYTSPESIK